MPDRHRRIVVEADGGSRGNPGPAAYGALIRDAETGMVIAERGETIGVATNNVAEYRGLIAGLELAAEHAPEAEVEVRMDSKLVIEQMAGRWKVRHRDMRPLASTAQSLAPFGVEWTWVPREENKAADALVNIALDQQAGRSPRVRASIEPTTEPVAAVVRNPMAGWRDPATDPPTTLILLRHGVTDNTVARLFCGAGGSDPGLNPDGAQQVRRAAAYLARHSGADALVTSPLRRTQETAAIVGRTLDLDVETVDGLVEAAFGDWDGLTYAEVEQRWPTELDAWLSSTATAPPGGEAYDAVYERVRATRNRLLARYAGKTVVAVSHLTPIKMFVRLALDAPMPVINNLELAAASLTTIRVWPDGVSTLRTYSYVPE